MISVNFEKIWLLNIKENKVGCCEADAKVLLKFFISHFEIFKRKERKRVEVYGRWKMEFGALI